MAQLDDSGDKAIQERIGARLRALRLNRNESQEQLAERAGIGKATLQRLEEGKSGTLVTFVRLLRALELSEGLDALLPDVESSPLEEARRERHQRVRRAKRGGKPDSSRWRWGDESNENR